ncbi:unnamed protein product, partial [Sphacelaria rigidula]
RGPVRLVLHAEKTKKQCVVITVLPTVTVVNCLPCPLSIQAVLPRQQAGRRRRRLRSHSQIGDWSDVLESGVVPTAQATNLHTLEVGDGARLSLRIAYHEWSPPSTTRAVLPSGEEELREGTWARQQYMFELPTVSGDGGFLELQCQFEPYVSVACPAVRLYVYCTHWLMDRSGLSLGFGDGDKHWLSVPREKLSTVPTGASSCSGGAAGTSSRRKISSRGDLEESWALGTEGLALCNAKDDEIRVAVPKGWGGGGSGDGAATSGSGIGDYGDHYHAGYKSNVWSDVLTVTNGSSGVFQVKGTRGEIYELALKAKACPGTFRRTTQVTVIPRYCILNLLEDENIWLKQPGASDSSAISIPPGGRVPWHWMANGGRSSCGGVRVRTKDTAWSYGDVMIDQVGTTALHIPFFGEKEDVGWESRGYADGSNMNMHEAVEGGTRDSG